MIRLSKPLLLASGSPRRHSLLRAAGYNFEVKKSDMDENYPADIRAVKVGEFLARKKAESFLDMADGHIVLTADTVVVLNDQILDKPLDVPHARDTLKILSGKMHQVITGVAFLCDGKVESFSDTTHVYFKKLMDWEIEYYIGEFKPFDKAGGYGIQEWIGMIGIDKIEGSYFNVMGLPVHLVHKYLSNFRLP